jgi:hypothetical protein
MRPRTWRVRCSRGTTSARPSGPSSGARGTRSGGTRRTSRPPIPLPSGRLCTKPVRSKSGKRRRRPAAPPGRCGSNCPHTTMWCSWPRILPPRDGRSARTAGTSSSGRPAKTTQRASPGSSPATAALMRVRPSGFGGSTYIHPGLTAEPLLAAAVFLDPGRLTVLRPALPPVRRRWCRLGRQGRRGRAAGRRCRRGRGHRPRRERRLRRGRRGRPWGTSSGRRPG